MARQVKVAAIQSGPLYQDPKKNLDYNLDLLDKAAKATPDYVVFPEFGITPFFCLGMHDKSFFSLAESVDGPIVHLFSAKAKEYGTNIVLPMFEKGEVEGEYFDSAVVISDRGELIGGTLPDGTKVKSARKNYISDFRWGENQVNDEKYYFRVGNGHPCFKTPKANIGVLICYERWYPEAWRVLALQGAEMVFVTNASAGYVSENALCLLKANAAMNAVYCICVNKAGEEYVKNAKANYYGLSAIVDPRGNVVAQAPQGGGEAILTSELDLDKLRDIRTDLFVYRDRKPEFYKIICS